MMRGLGRLRAGATFSPLSLFAAGEQGIWLDPSDFSTMFQDSAGTTPVTAVEQPVGKILDKSGRGNHATQATTANRPVLSARVNLLLQSNAFAIAPWGSTGAPILTAGTTTGPDGTTSGSTWSRTTTGACFTQQGVTKATQTLPYTYSMHVKQKTGRYVALRLQGTYPAKADVAFDLQTGTISTAAAVTGSFTAPTASITALSSGWYRITLSATTDTANAVVGYFSAFTAAGHVIDDGDSAATADVYVYGAQLNASALTRYQNITTAASYDAAGFPLYLAFNGTNSSLSTASINLTGTALVTMHAGVRKLSDSIDQTIYELSAAGDANPGGFYLRAAAGGLHNYQGAMRGATTTNTVLPAATAPDTAVLTDSCDLATPLQAMRRNGVLVGSNNGTTGGGNFGNYPLYIGARSGSSIFFNGNLYGLIVRGALSTAAEIASAETYMNQRTGAY